MELLVAIAIGALTASGLYLVLRARTFPVILGVSLLSYAVNVFLFTSGRLVVNQPPILRDDITSYTDPLPQALVLTAIVISFGMTAVVVLLSLGAFLSAETDRIDIEPGAPEEGSAEAQARTDAPEPPAPEGDMPEAKA